MHLTKLERLIVILKKIHKIMREHKDVKIHIEAYEVVDSGTPNEAYEIVDGWDITDVVEATK